MDIQHDVRQGKFYAIVKGTEYSLEYNDLEPNLWEFHCPFLTGSQREQEALDKIIEYAMYYMKRKGIRLCEVGSCSRVKDYLERKKELQETLVV
ncbi:hypothetical protein RCC89_12135 [Cytophagaceae bacterium ABcell3]|nr:hypothetical protein RCC89_12135 [Cytophagaceae bacterium ABcell3]